MVIIKTKYIGEVKTQFRRSAEVRYTFEDRIQDWIKINMGIRD